MHAQEASSGLRKDNTMADRSKFVEKLLYESSASQHIDASSNPEAKARRERARELYQQAVAAKQSGDTQASEKLFTEATKTMFEAARLAEQNVVIEKKRSDYDSRLESINALLAAHDRIRQEKGLGDGAELRAEVDKHLTRAKELYDRDQIAEARAALDEAYVAAKVAIEGLRGGDTLVRTLNFASKEEEYRYELDRNDTHKLLIEVLAKEKLESSGMGAMVQKFIDKANALRSEAESMASQGDFEGAIKTLEESTKNLVRAIRGAGIYIPG